MDISKIKEIDMRLKACKDNLSAADLSVFEKVILSPLTRTLTMSAVEEGRDQQEIVDALIAPFETGAITVDSLDDIKEITNVYVELLFLLSNIVDEHAVDILSSNLNYLSPELQARMNSELSVEEKGTMILLLGTVKTFVTTNAPPETDREDLVNELVDQAPIKDADILDIVNFKAILKLGILEILDGLEETNPSTDLE